MEKLCEFCPMELQIRNLFLDDAKNINDLSSQLGYPLSVKETEECIREVLSTKDHVAFVAVIDNSVVGWIHGFKVVTVETKPFVEIGGLVVDEKFRGKQIGKKLVERIKQWAEEKNILTIRVRSNVKRNDAHKFYEAIGFPQIKQQKVFQSTL